MMRLYDRCARLLYKAEISDVRLVCRNPEVVSYDQMHPTPRLQERCLNLQK